MIHGRNSEKKKRIKISNRSINGEYCPSDDIVCTHINGTKKNSLQHNNNINET